jgi:spermidine synthase
MHQIIPEGTSGNVQIRHRRYTEQERKDALAEHDLPDWWLRSDTTYTVLIVDDAVMMSDVLYERMTLVDIVKEARGDVLVAGLGIGMILLPVAEKDEVTSITVIENNEHVIRLVEPYIREHIDKPFTVIHADAFDWTPTQTFDTIYFDIWPTADLNNLKQMGELHERYANALRPGGWMQSWMHSILEKVAANLVTPETSA